MGQVTIYLDSKTEKKMNSIVKKTGISKSKWISDLIKQRFLSMNDNDYTMSIIIDKKIRSFVIIYIKIVINFVFEFIFICLFLKKIN